MPLIECDRRAAVESPITGTNAGCFPEKTSGRTQHERLDLITARAVEPVLLRQSAQSFCAAMPLLRKRGGFISVA